MNLKPRINQASGFTMVELMIVVIVLGIVVTIALPSYTASVERAKCAQAVQILKTMRTAALSFFTDKQTFIGVTPTTLGTQINANFFANDVLAESAANENQNWYYSASITTASVIQVQAYRRGGRHIGTTLTLTDDVITTGEPYWGGDYPLIENIILFDN